MNMRKYVASVILFTVVFLGCRTSKPASDVGSAGKETTEKPAVTNFSEQITWLLGYINPVQFTNPPHSEWFVAGHDCICARSGGNRKNNGGE